MRKIFFFFLIVFSIQEVFAQNKPIDSLKASGFLAKQPVSQRESSENQNLTQSNKSLLWGGLLGLSILGYIFWNNRLLRKKNKELATKNREIEEALLKGQTIERKRVATQLHDNLNTKVAALRWRLEAIDSSNWEAKDIKNLDEIIQTTNQVYDDIRLISHNLLPYELETQGLPFAIQKLVSDLNANTKIKFHFVSETSLERFQMKIEYELYTILLELVNNIIKHSKAKKAWISLSNQAQQLILTVKDDGIGLSQTFASGGVGLKNLASRIEHLNGKWQIENLEGAMVKIEIPLLVHGS